MTVIKAIIISAAAAELIRSSRSMNYHNALLRIYLTVASVALLLLCCDVSGVPLELAGNSIIVRKGGNVQDALDRAMPGDTILLEAGVTFKGSFKLPKKSGSEFITIR